MTTIEVPGRVKRRQVPNSLKGQFYEGELNPRFISYDALKMHRMFEVEQFFLSKNQITKFGTRPCLGFPMGEGTEGEGSEGSVSATLTRMPSFSSL